MAARLGRVVYQMSYVAFRALGEADPDESDRVGAAFAPLPAEAATLVDGVRRNAPAFHDQTDRIADLLDTYAKLTGAMCDMAKKGMSAQALTLAHKKVDPLQKTLFAELDTFVDDLSTSIRTGSEALSADTRTILVWAIGLSAAGIAASILIGVLVVNVGVAHPLGRLTAALKTMSAGQLDAEIPEARRGDEIGAIGKAVEGIKALVARKAIEQAESKRMMDAAAADDRSRVLLRLAADFEDTVGRIIGLVFASRRRPAGHRPDHDRHRGADRRPVHGMVTGAAEEAAADVNTGGGRGRAARFLRRGKSAGRSAARPPSLRTPSPRPTGPRPSCRISAPPPPRSARWWS